MSQISQKQHVAVVALLTERTVGGAAKSVGVARRTLERWMKDDEVFKDALATAQQAAFDETIRGLSSLSASAINVLADELTNDNAALRVRVALAILDRLADFASTRSSESKLEEFERLVDSLAAMEKEV